MCMEYQRIKYGAQRTQCVYAVPGLHVLPPDACPQDLVDPGEGHQLVARQEHHSDGVDEFLDLGRHLRVHRPDANIQQQLAHSCRGKTGTKL